MSLSTENTGEFFLPPDPLSQYIHGQIALESFAIQSSVTELRRKTASYDAEAHRDPYTERYIDFRTRAINYHAFQRARYIDALNLSIRGDNGFAIHLLEENITFLNECINKKLEAEATNPDSESHIPAASQLAVHLNRLLAIKY